MVSEATITRDWNIAEIVTQYPQTVEVFTEYKLHCMDCQIGAVESLEEGCRGHGLQEEDINLLVEDLNDCIATTEAKPKKISITKEAAEEIKKMAEDTMCLSVQANKDGSFCMEFMEKKESDEKEFSNSEVPDVKIRASLLTLQRIGGATIVFKDNSFKLEI